MRRELWARIRYSWLCLVAVDGSWSMGAHLYGSIWPLGGRWINGRGSFNRYQKAVQ